MRVIVVCSTLKHIVTIPTKKIRWDVGSICKLIISWATEECDLVNDLSFGMLRVPSVQNNRYAGGFVGTDHNQIIRRRTYDL